MRPAIVMGLAIFSLNILLLIFFFKRLPPLLPLFYSLPWGEEQLAGPTSLILLPFGSFVLGSFNFLFAAFVFKDQPLAAKILIWAIPVLILLCVITLIEILFLVI